jgi:AraC family transcriptional activator of pobA
MEYLFQIRQMTEEEALEIQNSVNEPHQHDFEELLVGMEGTLEHFIDFTSEKVENLNF